MASRSERALHALVVLGVLAGAAPARADTPPADEPKVDVMHVLAARGLHDLTEELFNVYGQISLMGQYKAPFSAKYTNLDGSSKSLLPTAEGSWTATATMFLGARLWHGAEAYLVPEVISERPLSGLNGFAGAVQNAELQKGGTAAPTLYLSRAYLRQTIGLGGAREKKASDAMQLGAEVDARRLVLMAGKFNPLDVFDRNAFAGDIRRQFMNLAFMTYAAWDSATDARGYTFGALAELYFDGWALRAAHTLVPLNPNDLPMDFRFWKYFGDQVELEHVHTILGQRGAVRVLGYRNLQNMGRFADAIAIHDADPAKNAANALAGCPNFVPTDGYASAYNSTNASAPDLCWARRPNVKLGIGVDLEQALGEDVGVFFRAMYSSGQTEVYAYFPADRSISFGAVARGTRWRRPMDSFGVGAGVNWISAVHAEYLGQGGIDGFIGDGRINQAAESIFEVFYSVKVLKPLWLTADYQHVTNPGCNADRGPVDIVGGRLHVEF